MSAVFADTSGLLALLNEHDEFHPSAESAFGKLQARRAPLISTSYALVETYALIGRRLGIEAVRSFRENFAPLLEVTWVDAPLHDAGLDLLLHRGKRRLSLVDAVSFVAMRQNGISEALAFDPHFEQEGYVLIG